MPSIWDCVCVCVLQMGLLSIFPVLVMRENATANYYFQTASLMDFGGKKRLPCFYVPCFTTFSCYMCDTHVRSEMNKRIESSFRKKTNNRKHHCSGLQSYQITVLKVQYHCVNFHARNWFKNIVCSACETDAK